MRAYWIVVLMAGAVFFTQPASAKKSTIKVNLTPAQVASICAPFVHSENIGTGPGGYGCSTSTTEIRCNRDGQCTITTTTTNAGFGKPKPSYVGVPGGAASLASPAVTLGSGKAGAASASNAFTAGAAQGSIAVSPLKQLGSNAATASTTMTVTPAKQVGSNAATGASPNPGAAVMSSGRATFRPQ